MNRLIRDIIGEIPEPARPEIKLPIIDDDPTKREPYRPSPAAERLFRQLELESAMEKIYGEREVVNMMKAAVSTGAFDNRALQDDTQARTGGVKFPALPQATDPRKKQCFCDCQFCRTQNCKNCNASPRCEFAALEGPLSDILPVDQEMLQAAHERQQKRFAGDSLRKHKRALLPAIHQFRKALWPKPSARIDQAVDAVANAAAEYVTRAVAGEF